MLSFPTFPNFVIYLSFLFSYPNPAAQRTNQINSNTDYCAHSLAQELAMQQSFKLLEKQTEFEQQAYHYFQNQKNGQEKLLADFTLPVVVHIIHGNGAENIPDAVVLQGIQDLNDAFANVGYYDPATGVDTRIQFCLAKRDPFGNATTGINRVQSPLTDMIIETEDIAMKDLSRWDPLNYINIWLVREICSSGSGCGVAGYAYFPSSHGGPEDGLVAEAGFFGSSNANSGVHIHEMGHYLGLYHTFQGGCGNDDCLLDGDRVCDTPPDQSTAWVPCNSSPNTCDTDANSGFATDQPDMIWNYMDYTDFNCYSAFTQGQADRMVFSIENPRASLLDSKGCVSPCTNDITADFSASETTVQAGQMVNFTNNSVNATAYDWQVNGTSFSNNTNASYLFDIVGDFEITLLATNADPNCNDSYTLNVTVTCPTTADFIGENLFPPVGAMLDFTNTSTGATGYEWLLNGVSLANTTDLSYTFTISGTYTLCLDATSQYCDDTECVTMFVFDDAADCGSTFIKTFGLPNSEEEGWVMTESDNGGYFMAGRSGDQTLLVKVDPTGTVAWARRFDLGPTEDYILSLKLDSDGMLVGCGHVGIGFGGPGAAFVFRYDHLNDNFLWIKNLENPAYSRWYTVLEKAPGDNFFALGQVANLGPLGCNGLLVEIDRATGNAVWMRNYHLGSCETFAKSVIADGDIFTTGRYNFIGSATNKMRPGISRIDFAGNEIWSRLYLVPVDPNDATIHSNGLIEDNGRLVSISSGDNDGISTTDITMHLYATDLNGLVIWAKNMNLVGGNEERVQDIVNLPDGYLILGNYLSLTRGRQIYLVKTDKQGEIVWSRQYGGGADEDAYNLLVNNGFIHFIGQTGTGGSGEFFMAKLNLEGQMMGPCDEIQDLTVTSENFPNPYDALHPLITSSENFPLTNYASASTTVMVEENPICENPCIEICDNGVDDDGDDYVDCYDPECPCNVDDCYVTDLDQNFATRLAWQSDVDAVSAASTPIVANLNPQVDNLPEIIVPRSESNSALLYPSLLIFKGDGSNADSPLEIPITNGMEGVWPTKIAVGDVDRDGVPEILVTTFDLKIRVFSFYDETTNPPMQEIVVSTDLVKSWYSDPLLADFNADGISEVYVGDDIFQFDFAQSPPTLTKKLTGGSSYGQMYYYNYFSENCNPVAVDMLQPSHCNGDPDCEGLELVAGNVIYSVDMLMNDGDGYEIKIQRDLNQMQAQFDYADGFTVVADIDLDGILDVVVSAGRGGISGIYAWNHNGLVGWFQHSSNAPDAGGIPCIANVYDDTQNGSAVDMPEIIVCNQFRLNCYNVNAASLGLPGNGWWSLPTTDDSGATGATAFDFNGDGIEEIVYRDQDNLRIMYGGRAPYPPGVDAARNWSTFVCGSPTSDEYPVVADIDFDKQAEIVVTGFVDPWSLIDDARGRLRVFEADLDIGDPWVGARPIWNQYNYFVVNVNDDLSIPVEQQLHHLEFPNIGSGHYPINKFVSQVPLLNEDYLPYLPVPDATVNVEAAECDGDSITLTLTVCNEGSAPLPAEMPIAFYLADPTVMAIGLHHTWLVEEAILPDNCFSLTANVPMANGTIQVVVNDDGSTMTPYSFNNDFPVTNILECNYQNNPTSFQFDYTPPPPPDLGPDQTFCNNGIAILDAGPGWATYKWQDGFPEQVYTAWEEGTYWVEVTDACGNVFSDTITITMDISAQFDLGPDTMICPNEMLVFDVPGFEVYEWLPDVELNCNDCNPVNATPTQPTTYKLVATDANGCVSVDSVIVVIDGSLEAFDTLQICIGDSILLFGNYESIPGDYIGTIPSLNGCDTVMTITLEVLPLVVAFDNVQVCENDSVLIFGNYETQPGDYIDTLPAVNGCDTIMTITLEVLPLVDAFDTVQVCENDSVLIFGNYETQPSDYIDTLPAVNGCDTIMTITLEVLPLVDVFDNVQVCENDSVLIFGKYETQPGDYIDTLSALSGCDTNMTITLEVLLLVDAFETVQVCENDSVLIFGKYETQPGDYIDTLSALSGCDTNMTITLEVLPLVDAFETVQVCENDSVLIFGKYETQPGDYIDTLPAVNDCDTVLTITLEVLPLVVAFESIQICEGDSILIFGNYETQPGDYVGILPAINGCDSIMTFSLEAYPPMNLAFNVEESCPDNATGSISVEVLNGVEPYGYQWSNGAITPSIENAESGQYGLTVTDAIGCFAESSVSVGALSANLVITDATDVSCFGFSDGVLAVSGFEQGSLFSMDGQVFTSDSIFSNLPMGSYSLYVQLPNGCLVEQNVIIEEPPKLNVTLPTDITIELGDSILLSSQVNSLTTLNYAWTPFEWLSCLDCPSLWAAPFETTIYTLLVTNETGCADEDNIEITVLTNVDVYVPNAFSPNGDGVNDNLTVFSGPGVARVKRLLVFDRWGELVFEGLDFPPNDLSYGWNGLFKGKEMGNAVFAWLAEIELVDGRQEFLKGDVTLIK